MEEFLSNFSANAELRNLEDIISWNKRHAEKALPERPLRPNTTLLTHIHIYMHLHVH